MWRPPRGARLHVVLGGDPLRVPPNWHVHLTRVPWQGLLIATCFRLFAERVGPLRAQRGALCEQLQSLQVRDSPSGAMPAAAASTAAGGALALDGQAAEGAAAKAGSIAWPAAPESVDTMLKQLDLFESIYLNSGSEREVGAAAPAAAGAGRCLRPPPLVKRRGTASRCPTAAAICGRPASARPGTAVPASCAASTRSPLQLPPRCLGPAAQMLVSCLNVTRGIMAPEQWARVGGRLLAAQQKWPRARRSPARGALRARRALPAAAARPRASRLRRSRMAALAWCPHACRPPLRPAPLPPQFFAVLFPYPAHLAGSVEVVEAALRLEPAFFADSA